MQLTPSTQQDKKIWTIGHSTLGLEDFLQMLQSFEVKLVADVRRYPGSRRYPHFNAEALEKSLLENDIAYQHFPSLGGRRQPLPDSVNTAWKHTAFRGYADYMSTDEFTSAATALMEVGQRMATAFMCSEAPWWRCHRSLIADYLKVHGWQVMHIMKAGKATEHPYTSPAVVVDGKLDYTGNAG